MPLNSRKCKECGCIFKKERPLQFVCSPKCAASYSSKQRSKQVNKEWREEKKVLRDKLKTLGEYEKEAKVFFQHWIRLRDNSKGYDCVSCGAKITIPTSDGSHYYNANQFSGLIFNEMNCHASCQKCNRFEGGRLLDYREGLITRYGADYLNDLESMKETHRNYKYTKQELIDIKVKYQKLIAEFKK